MSYFSTLIRKTLKTASDGILFLYKRKQITDYGVCIVDVIMIYTILNNTMTQLVV